MSKDKQDQNEFELQHDEPALEDFLVEEEDHEQSRKRKRRRILLVRTVAIFVSLFLVVNVLGVWFNIFNLNALDFLKTSSDLSQNEDVKQWKEAVVTIQGEASRATGFAVSSDGLIVTNHHVVEGEQTITVAFASGELFIGHVVHSVPDLDLALIKVAGTDLPTLALSETKTMEKEPVFVIGNPLSHTQIVNQGVILEDHETMVISASIYKGNSGSPVIRENGEVVGVVYATRTIDHGSKQSVGLAVPIKLVISHLLEGYEGA